MREGLRISGVLVPCALVVCLGCGGDDIADTGPDAATDSGVDAILPWPGDEPPIAPVVLTPCPDGWRESVDEDLTVCEPYPEGGYRECPAGHAHFPGEEDCQPVGDPCPAGDFADGLPDDGSVIFVREGAAGGDGTRVAPYGLLSDVDFERLATGTTVALAKGGYFGVVALSPGTRLVGACSAETSLTGVPISNFAHVSLIEAGEPAVVENVTVAGSARPGVWVEAGANLRLEGVVLDDIALVSAFSTDVGSLLELSEVVVRGTRADIDGGGRALGTQAGGRIEGTRVILDRNIDGAIFTADPGSAVVLSEAYVRGTLTPDEVGSRGVVVQAGGRFEGRAVLFEANREIGIFAGRAGSVVELEDVIVRGTLPRLAGDDYGRGINVQDGATLTASRVVIERNHDQGLVVGRADATATVTDTVIRDTLPVPRTSDFGRGITVQEGASLTATRILITRNHDVGVVVTDGEAEVLLEDATIRDTIPRASASDHGYGLQAQITGRLTLRRARIENNFALGVSSLSAELTMEDVLVRGTVAAACADTTCAELPFGYGVTAIEGVATVERFLIDQTATCGVFLASASPEVDLSYGVISRATIGACVQVDGYDISRLTNEVRYVDNERSLDSTSLPVPDVIDPSR